MAHFVKDNLEINDIYKEMIKTRQLNESVAGGNNSIHAETEKLIEELSGEDININPEELEKRLTELEKLELTSLDKKVVTNIRKALESMKKAQESFESFTKKLKYEYVVTPKASAKKAEEELKAEDENFKTDEDITGEEETVIPKDEFEKENI